MKRNPSFLKSSKLASNVCKDEASINETDSLYLYVWYCKVWHFVYVIKTYN